MHKFPTKFSGLEEYFVGLRKWVFSCFCHFGFWQSKKGFLSPVCLLRKGFLFPVSFHFTNVKIYMHNFPANFSDSVENFSASFFFFLVISFSDLPLVFILNLGGFFRFLFGLCENAGKGNQSWVLVTFVGLFDVKTPPLLSIQLGHPSANFLVAQKMQERDKFAQLFYCFFFFLF